jgi:hypothetical protein
MEAKGHEASKVCHAPGPVIAPMLVLEPLE